MTAPDDIQPALSQLIKRLRAMHYPIDAMLSRVLRDFGVACWEAGAQSPHSRSTIPAPRADDSAGRYSIRFDDDNDPEEKP